MNSAFEKLHIIFIQITSFTKPRFACSCLLHVPKTFHFHDNTRHHVNHYIDLHTCLRLNLLGFSLGKARVPIEYIAVFKKACKLSKAAFPECGSEELPREKPPSDVV